MIKEVVGSLMSNKKLLTAVLTVLSLLESTWCVAQGDPGSAPVLTISEVKRQLPLSKVDTKGYLHGVKLSEIKIDYLKIEPPHDSYSALAANVTSTLGGLCHFGKVKNTQLEVVQSCPAPNNTIQRLEAWEEFFKGTRSNLPPGGRVYVIPNGRDIFPVEGAELKIVVDAEKKKKPALISRILTKKTPISIQLSPACEFHTPAKGRSITELCGRSLPVHFPDFAARIDGSNAARIDESNLILTRLIHGESSAYLALTAPNRPQVRVQVNVKPLRCSFDGQTFPMGRTVTAFPNSVVPAGGVCTGTQLTCEPKNTPVLLSVGWHKGKSEFDASESFLNCRVDQASPSSSSAPSSSSEESSSSSEQSSSSSEEPNTDFSSSPGPDASSSSSSSECEDPSSSTFARLLQERNRLIEVAAEALGRASQGVDELTSIPHRMEQTDVEGRKKDWYLPIFNATLTGPVTMMTIGGLVIVEIEDEQGNKLVQMRGKGQDLAPENLVKNLTINRIVEENGTVVYQPNVGSLLTPEQIIQEIERLHEIAKEIDEKAEAMNRELDGEKPPCVTLEPDATIQLGTKIVTPERESAVNKAKSDLREMFRFVANKMVPVPN